MSIWTTTVWGPQPQSMPSVTKMHKNSREEAKLVTCINGTRMHTDGEGEEERTIQCIMGSPMALTKRKVLSLLSNVDRMSVKLEDSSKGEPEGLASHSTFGDWR